MDSSTRPNAHGTLLFRSDIQGLRGLAILLVVAYHAGFPGVTGGYVGVDVFFVVSGYLITGLLVKEIGKTGTLDLPQFYARRARRLLPAAFLVVLMTIVFGYLLTAPLEQRVFANTALATILYISNFWFIRQSTDYFSADASANPLLHTWSLAVEEQFYFVWPLLLLLVATRIQLGSPRNRLAAAMTAIVVLSFAAGLWLTQVAQSWAFFSSPARAWEFAAGGLAFLLAPNGLGKPRTLRSLGWLGLAAVLIAGLAFTHSTPFPGIAASLPVAGTVLLLVAGSGGALTGITSLLSTSFMQWLGALSYSWYLWHWPVLVYIDVVFGGLDLAGRTAALLVSLALAALTYALVENPIRYNRALSARPVLTLALAAVLTVGGAGIARAWRVVADSAASTHEQHRFAQAHDELPPVYADGCHAWYDDVVLPDCIYGVADSPTTVVVFGDSHAAEWFPPFEILARESGFRLISWTKSECPYPAVSLVNDRLGREYDECSQWRSATLKRIVALRPALVVLASANRYALSNPSPRRLTLQQWEDGIRSVVETLAREGIRVVLVRDNPRPGLDVPACLARAAWQAWGDADDCRFDKHDPQNAAVFEIERRVAASVPGTLNIDLYDLICSNARCEVERDGRLLYQDSNHLTVDFSRTLAPALKRALEPALTMTSGARPAASPGEP